MAARGRGFTLIEIAVALAVLGIMTAVVFIALQTRLEDAKIRRAVGEIRTIEQGVAWWIQGTLRGGSLTFTGLSMRALTDAGAVPAALGQPTANPWAGAYLVTGDGETFTITVTDIPNARACTALAGVFGRQATVTCPGSYPGAVTLAFHSS